MAQKQTDRSASSMTNWKLSLKMSRISFMLTTALTFSSVIRYKLLSIKRMILKTYIWTRSEERSLLVCYKWCWRKRYIDVNSKMNGKYVWSNQINIQLMAATTPIVSTMLPFYTLTNCQLEYELNTTKKNICNRLHDDTLQNYINNIVINSFN